MIRHGLFWITLGVAGLWFWDRQHRSVRWDDRTLQQVPFFTEDQRNTKAQVAGMVLEGSGGERFEYFRQQGVWRLATPAGVLAEEARILRFWHAMADAVARPVPLSPEQVGLHPLPRWSLTLHGRGMRRTAAGDALFRVELGNSMGQGGVWARVGTSGPVQLLREHPLGDWQEDDALPPFADRHVVPTAWPTSHEPITVLRLILDGRVAWEQRSDPENSSWILEADGGQRPMPAGRVRSWLEWLRSLEGTSTLR